MVRFDVKGMSCNHCVQAVTRAIQDVDTRAQVAVDLDRGEVRIDTQANPEALAAAIEDAGYEVTGRHAA
jgi:copper chaperone CopZ